ncbi:MAG: TlpA family protein disulfide reductase [Oscillospiraceae bacterium]|nr:TlpA family protein disulfide reductase [Oscillospiraceae bacterium]
MKHKKSLVVLILVFALLLAGAYFLYGALQAQHTPSSQLPVQETDTPSASASESERIKAMDITFFDRQDTPHQLSELEGRPVILSFWADWCGACKGHMPYLNESYTRHKDDIQFVLLNIPADREAIQRSLDYVEEQNYSFPFYHDIQQTSTYTYSIAYFPTTFFIDAEGYLEGYYVGQLTPDLLQQGIDLICK